MKKPHYKEHRTVLAQDVTDLDELAHGTDGEGGPIPGKIQGAISLCGFDSAQGLVVFSGGTGPAITLQPLEAVNLPDGTRRFVSRGAAIGPLSDGEGFAFDCPGGGLWFLQATALTGAPDNAKLFVAGGLRANEGSI